MPRITEEVRRQAYLFEQTSTIEQIRDAALRMQCGKIDKELVKRFKVKEELVDYLRSRDCPALIWLQAQMVPIR